MSTQCRIEHKLNLTKGLYIESTDIRLNNTYKGDMIMIKNKKAQGLSITTIIVAAIAVVVLVVLIAIFTSNIGQSRQIIDSESDADAIRSAIVGGCNIKSDVESVIEGRINAATEESVKITIRGELATKSAACRVLSHEACTSSTNKLKCEWK